MPTGVAVRTTVSFGLGGRRAYQIESKRGSEIVLTKHPEHWRTGLPKLDVSFIALSEIRKNSNFTVNSTPGREWDYTQFTIL